MLGDGNAAPIRPSPGLVHSSSPNIPRNGSCDTARVPAHRGMNNVPSDSTADRHPALGDASSSMDVSPAFSPASQWTGIPSEDDRRLHNVGVAALAAVSQYPHAMNEDNSSFLVSEVVSAMTGSAQSAFHNPQSMALETDEDSSETDHQGGVYLEAESSMSEPDPSSSSAPSDHDMQMEGIVNDLIERTATWQNTATIASEHSHPNMHKDLVMDYDFPFEDYTSLCSSGSDDEMEDLLKFYPGEEVYFQRKQTRSPEGSIHDVDLDEFYDHVTYDDPDLEVEPPQLPQDPIAPGPIPEESLEDMETHPASIIHTTTTERNHTIDEFIHRWMVQSRIVPAEFHSEGRIPPQFRPLSKIINWRPPRNIYRPQKSKRDFFDLQQIPWAEILKVKRADARSLRDTWYTSYHNVNHNANHSHTSQAKRLPRSESFFQAKSMHTAHKASIEHFQLRNLMSVTGYNTVQFASRSKIYSWAPDLDSYKSIIDLSRPDPDVGILSPVKISSMKAGHGLTVAGGFGGEYAVQSSDGKGSGMRGLVTPDFHEGITCHVDIIRNRTGRSPICVFASNDRHLRILDCETNIFISDQELSRPINCTATSPDSRLRVVIGDSPDAWIIEADTGRPVHPLRGHRDFGFACAWSPDMRHIATSNQDKTVNIWDARTWRVLETIDSDIAGYRSLRFSPVGGGPRTLLCCEPADRISIIDAQLYQTRQVHDFFGEIGGADYSPDGSTIWVANTDPHFGGFMQYERHQWDTSYGLADQPPEWLHEPSLGEDERCILRSRERRLRFLRSLTDEEHDQFRI
ncbi:hypothetical protein N7466_010823 [Penicillium verhagenii]|uniref:uncharacterized protein n=1 Tax=Penicillium verhagenii TaxID=1562060 RepID=UPI0025457351|nr:uncharacterized protein N7466_010823 [Penicillium verhagenii]KAJ5917269.1 hypothetical protein N7466_010823 [Penicillium verhagenii]